MNPFITYREKDENGVLQYYILQRDFPHFIGVILPSFEVGNWYAPISGYMLWVNFAGTIRGGLIPSYRDISDEINYSMQKMADWYLPDRVLVNKKKYKKWEIK